MANRIYLGIEGTKYAKLIGGAVVTIIGLFCVLAMLGFTITGSNDVCLGTPEDPCVSYGKICNTGPTDYDIYNPDAIRLDFSPSLKNYWMFFKDGRVKKEFLMPLGIDFSTAGWRYENFTDDTKPLKDRVYVHRFAKYSCQDYMIVGLKNNPTDIVKWGVGVASKYLDPFWYAPENATAETSVSTELEMELGSQINVSVNLTSSNYTCFNVDHPDYGDNYTCGEGNATFLFNITYFRKTDFEPGIVSSYEMNVTNETNGTVYIPMHQYDEVIGASFNITVNSTVEPKLWVYINDTLSNDLGQILSESSVSIDELSDESTSKNYTFVEAGGETDYLYIPKVANVTSATLNVTGYNNATYCYQEQATTATYCGGKATGSYSYSPPSWSNPEYVYDGDNSTASQTSPNSGAIYFYYAKPNNPVDTTSQLWWVKDATSSGFLGVPASCYSAYASEIRFKVFENPVSYYMNWACDEGGGSYTVLKDTNPVYWNTIFIYEEAMYWYVYYPKYPENMTLEIGTVDGDYEWNTTTQFTSTTQIDDFSDEISDFLDGCTEDEFGYCLVPMYLVATEEGRLEISNIEVNYTYNPNPVELDLDVLQDFLDESSGDVNVSIVFESTQNITLTVDDLKYDYAGGNDTIEVVAFNYWNTSENETLNLINIYSDWDYAFPTNVQYLEIIPSTPTKANVTPFGQNTATPIFNMTNYGYSARAVNFSVYLEETHACVNLTMSNDSSKDNGTQLNASWIDLFYFDYLETEGIWMWADYNCSYSTWNLWQPLIYFRPCCYECVCSEELS